METIKLNLPARVMFPACIAALVFAFGSPSYGADVTWTGNVNNRFEVGGNWDNGTGPIDKDYVEMDSGTVNYSSSSGTSANLRGIRQSGGTLNISGGQLNVAELASAVSFFDGSVNQTGGDARINAARIGFEAGSNGSYTLSDGEFHILRTRDGISLHVGGLSSGSGSLTISGGSFLTRKSVYLGGAAGTGPGVLTVLGSEASEIGVGGVNDDNDGSWHQHGGSTLVLRMDVGGTTPIFVHDNSNSDGTSAIFDSGSLLDVDHLSGSGAGGGTWTVLEVENGDVVDNGLAFAPGVDTSVWSFRVDNSGANGRLLVTAVGDPVGFDVMVGTQRQQKMRYGMDYERLWFWTNSLNAAERDDIAKWSAIDTRIDYIRVAMNSAYELEEGNFNLSAYTNKIIPLMQEMKDANPDIKFFASPRPLDEAISGARWQPYPRWVTGDPGNGNFDFQWQKCAEYLERYLVLMDSYGFKISFMDLTNEWQTNSSNGAGASSRINQADAREITEYLKASAVLANANIDVPLFIAPSAWNYSQGSSWISNLSTQRRRDAVDIAACHNTDRTGSAQQFADAVTARFSGANDTMPEIWNTEVHGWKSTSGENETTSFYYMLEKIRAGFSGLNGWLAIGTTNQGHAYILNPNGTPRRNVKYFIFKKLSETSNYGYALDIVEEPSQLSHTAALIRGNLMTVWVINQGFSNVPLNVSPLGRTISETSVRRTRWTDPSDVEGFVTHEPVNSSDQFHSVIPGQSVCCFEILLEPADEDFAHNVIQAEDDDQRAGWTNEQSGDADGSLNAAFISNDDFARYNDVAMTEDSSMRFRVARPSGRPDGWIEIYLLAPGAQVFEILTSEPAGKVAVPETGNWQVYETIEASLENAEGSFDVVLRFKEVGSSNGTSLFNLNWLSAVGPASSILGDFDQDGDVDVNDLDWYNGNIGIAATGVLQTTDLDGDGFVSVDDFHQHYESLVETSNGRKGTFAGDRNLDGAVDVLGDAFGLVGNHGNLVDSWSVGDFNADGTVDVLRDAFLLVANLGRSND